jgi:hypothetical protein
LSAGVWRKPRTVDLVDSPEARAVSHYFGRGRGVTLYVWTSDQHTHYATPRRAHDRP